MHYKMDENKIPYKLVKTNGGLHCHWLNIDNNGFTEPFFDETISRLKLLNNQGQLSAQISDLPALEERARNLDLVQPAAIIFHLSRCGSTLTTQLFATSARFTVLSEVPFFDDLLRLPVKGISRDENLIATSLISALKFYSRKKSDIEEHVIIKTDSWHIFFYEQLRQIFPSVPFILMFRNPDEILRSLMKIPGSQIVPELVEPEIFGLPGIPEFYQKETYAASVLEKLLENFIEVGKADERVLLVNYNEGPIPVINKIAAFANLEITEKELIVMKDRSLFHSKRPTQHFFEEPVKQMPPCIDNAMGLYKILEGERRQQDGVK